MPGPEKLTPDGRCRSSFTHSQLTVGFEAKVLLSLGFSFCPAPREQVGRAVPKFADRESWEQAGQAWQRAPDGQAGEGETGPGLKWRLRAGFPWLCLSNPVSIFISSFLG